MQIWPHYAATSFHDDPEQHVHSKAVIHKLLNTGLPQDIAVSFPSDITAQL
jgi:hypothetical protein